MRHLSELMASQPVVPYIRESDYAVRRPWRNPERRLLDYLLIYVQEGSCRFRVEGVDHFFREGSFCLIQPGILNELEGLTNTVTPFAHFDIFYNPKRELSFPTRPGQIDLTAYRELQQPRLNDLPGIEIPVRLKPARPLAYREAMLELVRLWREPEPISQLKAQLHATELVATILEDHVEDRSPPRDALPSLGWIPSYLSNHLGEPLAVDDMAQRANLSVSRFSALFKKQFGLAPHRYLLELRLRHARELLLSTDLPQEDIAAYCGFADIHHFSKAFRRKTGHPPGEWRRTALADDALSGSLSIQEKL